MNFLLLKTWKKLKITNFFIFHFIVDNDYRVDIDFTIYVVYNERRLNSDNRYQYIY